MSEYRKKPVVVEAVQFLPGQNDAELLAHLEGCKGWHMADSEHGIIVPTLEGDLFASPGDWIIRGVKGEFYPCKPDIFAATYEPAAVPVPEGERVREAAEDAVASILIQRTSVIGGRTLAADIVDAILPLLQPAAQQNDSVADKTISAQQDALKEVEL